MNARWILAAAASCGLLVVLFAFRAGGPERTPSQPAAAAPREAASRAPAPTDTPSAGASPAAAPAVAVTPAPVTQAVPQILEAIHEASISYDAKELPKIQPYLIHPDVEVRTAALEGVLTLGDAAGSPLLRQAASTLKDPREAVKYLDAADYLELPSGSLLAGKKKAGSAAKDEARKDGSPSARIPFLRNRD